MLERDRARLLSEQMAEAQAAVSAAHAAHAQLQQEAATTAMEASQVRASSQHLCPWLFRRPVAVHSDL